ncbi:MAG: ferrous iron transport protein B [Dissulfurispiraceae bacterium]|jgi:ferrous iron transport protein B|nr:ferrous iron transport protein B [Dissulfurispiraceae bacterium]
MAKAYKNESRMKRKIVVAVAGNPNSGKSTLINALSGSRLHVGNWPGVTVEKKSAILNTDESEFLLVDLPGVYSLSPYTQEEIIARDYLVQEKPDVIINVIDATNIERNLYLTIQLLELNIPVVLAMNMYDEALDKGFKIDQKIIEDTLGVRVVNTVATKKTGLSELLDAARDAVLNQDQKSPKSLSYGLDIDRAVEKMAEALRADNVENIKDIPLRWIALKAIEGDSRALEDLGLKLDNSAVEHITSHLQKAHDSDLESVLADARYGLAAGLVREALVRPKIQKIELTEKIDKIVLNKYIGIPIFFAAMWLVFKLTFDISTPFVDWIEATATGPISSWAAVLINLTGLPDWINSLFVDGVIAGAGFVMVFVPVIFAMMFFITFLEGSGYMARAAFVMDKAMHTMGLHGKSFIPMLLGFGCNVPAIYATRTLENKKDRILTSLLIPLMSCGARLPVYALFTAVFFSAHAGIVLWSLYVLGILLAVLMGIIFKKTIFKGDTPMFIMELPPYRMPSFRNLIIHTWEKGKHFLIKAGTYILAMSVLVWFLLNLPWGVEHKKDSYLGMAGQVVAPVLEPLGFGKWEAASSLITGVIAKEIVVGTMGEIYADAASENTSERFNDVPSVMDGMKEISGSFVKAIKESIENVFSTFGVASLSAEEDNETRGLKKILEKEFTPLSSYAFMVFVLLYMPCMVVAIAMRLEFGTWKWSALAFAYQSALAWIAAFAVYQGGKLLGFE